MTDTPRVQVLILSHCSFVERLPHATKSRGFAEDPQLDKTTWSRPGNPAMYIPIDRLDVSTHALELHERFGLPS